MHWVLIIYMVASTVSSRTGVSVASVPGFTSQQSCEAAAVMARGGVAPLQAYASAICIEVK